MTYVTQTWVDGATPVDASHMNHIEAGIAALDAGTSGLWSDDGTNLNSKAGRGVNANGYLFAANNLVAANSIPQGQVTVGSIGTNLAGLAFYGPSSYDTYLYRPAGSPNTLLASGKFIAGTDLYAQFGLAKQVFIGDMGNAGLLFGSANDVNLYRNAASQLRTDGMMIVTPKPGYAPGLSIDAAGNGAEHFVQMRKVSANYPVLVIPTDGSLNWGPGDATNNTDSNIYRQGARILGSNSSLNMGLPGTGVPAVSAVVDGDANYRWYVRADGAMNWGPGSTAPDTNLYRIIAGQLRTDGNFDVMKTLAVGTALALGNASIATQAPGDAQWRYLMDNAGTMQWGSGAVVQDTKLYRSAAGVLKTDGGLVGVGYLSTPNYVAAGTNVYVDNGGTGAKLLFGSATDTNLYRSAASSLQTDGALTAQSMWTQLTSLSAVAFGTWVTSEGNDRFHLLADGKHTWGPGNAAPTDTNLYRSAAGVLKTDGILNAVGGLQVNGVTVAPTGATTSTTKGSVASSTTTSYTHMGYGVSITPTRSGRVVIALSGPSATNGTGSQPDNPWGFKLRYGTGTAPSAGAAEAGTQIGATISNDYDSYGGPTHTGTGTINIVKVLTGLTVGTAYWFDLTCKNLTIGGMNIDIWEL